MAEMHWPAATVIRQMGKVVESRIANACRYLVAKTQQNIEVGYPPASSSRWGEYPRLRSGDLQASISWMIATPPGAKLVRGIVYHDLSIAEYGPYLELGYFPGGGSTYVIRPHIVRTYNENRAVIHNILRGTGFGMPQPTLAPSEYYLFGRGGM